MMLSGILIGSSQNVGKSYCQFSQQTVSSAGIPGTVQQLPTSRPKTFAW